MSHLKRDILKLSRKGLVVVLSGPTAAGKGTIYNELIKENDNAFLSISATSREMRPGDINGKTYHFLSTEEFEEKIKKDYFLEYEKVHYGQYYGTPKKPILEALDQGKDIFMEIDIRGAINMKQIMPEALFIFIMPPSIEIMKQRIIARGTETKEQILSRFKVAYKEINEVSKYNYVIINDDLDIAINKAKSIIMAEKCRVDRIEEIRIGNAEEEVHEGMIDDEEMKKIGLPLL